MGNQPNVRLRAIIFLGIAGVAALALGVVVVGLYQQYVQRIADAEREDPAYFYLVAATELNPGIPITENDLFAVEISPRYLHKGGKEGSNLFTNYEKVRSRLPKERILPNEFIREERLADKDAGTGLNALIPRGMRAIAVQLSGGRAVQGFLSPWDYVDVMVTFTPEDSIEDSETHYLQQSVLVLGVGHRVSDEELDTRRMSRLERRRLAQAARTVTLAVSPQQAEWIAHGQALGQLTLTLRNNADVEPVEGLKGVGMLDLFGVQTVEN